MDDEESGAGGEEVRRCETCHWELAGCQCEEESSEEEGNGRRQVEEVPGGEIVQPNVIQACWQQLRQTMKSPLPGGELLPPVILTSAGLCTEDADRKVHAQDMLVHRHRV